MSSDNEITTRYGGPAYPPVLPTVLLRSADRKLLKRVHAVLLTALADTPKSLASPSRKEALEEVLAEVAEELGAKTTDVPVAEEQRFVTLANGTKLPVR